MLRLVADRRADLQMFRPLPRSRHRRADAPNKPVMRSTSDSLKGFNQVVNCSHFVILGCPPVGTPSDSFTTPGKVGDSPWECWGELGRIGENRGELGKSVLRDVQNADVVLGR